MSIQSRLRRESALRILAVVVLLFSAFLAPATLRAQEAPPLPASVSFPGNYGQAIGAPLVGSGECRCAGTG